MGGKSLDKGWGGGCEVVGVVCDKGQKNLAKNQSIFGSKAVIYGFKQMIDMSETFKTQYYDWCRRRL